MYQHLPSFVTALWVLFASTGVLTLVGVIVTRLFFRRGKSVTDL